MEQRSKDSSTHAESSSPVQRTSSSEPPEDASDLKWMILLGLLATVLLVSSFFYSWSAWKLDAKARFGWGETDVSTVFAFANAGQNFAVHLGLFYDTQGPQRACLGAAALKAAGQLGMRWCCAIASPAAWLFGACFFLDTQGTVLVIIMAQNEAQKASKASRSGTAASVCTGAFGAGAIVWVMLYDRLFSPDLESTFMFAGGSCTFLLLVCAVALPSLSPKRGPVQAKKSQGGVETGKSERLRMLIQSNEFASFFACTLVAWGIPMVWVANAASFSTAAELTNGAAIRSGFFTASLLGRVLCGPITDAVRLAREVWLVVTVGIIVSTAAGMLITAGSAMFPLACITGMTFGFVTTLVPLQCKSMDAALSGTLYAISKVGAMASSTAWTFIAGYYAQQRTEAGQTSCIGPACYRTCWLSMLVVAIPLSHLYVPWSFQAARRAKKIE
eukprot:TRINITY_DN25587_c0_g1_i1.p1 TRINITY_DN25587_c0_g1~~TRINITY_DN25587_c0_g1_i1.p1  ORF type:complete len:461 (+),score=40.89 TRINITY_DN25587_c0_g1_i1:50-1384(+)